MNATVTKIVELMFQDVEMTEEVRAIRDEVMNNCQERFDDLMARGLSEDEAISAVVGSLDGMKEVLAGYPRREQPDDRDNGEDEDDDFEDEDDDEEGEEGEVLYSARGVNQVAVELLSEGLEVGVSDDDKIHVIAGEDTWPLLRVTTENGVLRIARVADEEQVWGKNGKRGFRVQVNSGAADIGRVIGDTMSKISMGNATDRPMKEQELDRVIKSATDKIGAFFKHWNMNIQFDSGTVTLLLPAEPKLKLSAQLTSGDVTVEDAVLSEMRIVTLSGDISISGMAGVMDRCEIKSTSGDVSLEDTRSMDLQVNTISGDVEANIPEEFETEHCMFKSTSGDLTLSGNVLVCDIASISGDLDAEGRMVRLNAQSTSGDVTVRAEMDDLRFGTINGDVEISVYRVAQNQCAVNGKSTSGDIVIHLPVDEANVHAKSNFGDVHIGRSLSLNTNSNVIVNVTSMNGDITVK